MWEYKHTDELYHYGVLGMKWGKRKIQRLQAKQNDMLSKRQIGTSKYINVSNKLYIADKKQKLHTARKHKDTVKIQNLKYDIKKAKEARSLGTYMLDSNQFKSMYKVKSTTKEGAAVHLAANNRVAARESTNRALRKIGGLAVTAAAMAPVLVPAIKSGKDFLSKVDLKTVRYDFVNQQFTGINKR